MSLVDFNTLLRRMANGFIALALLAVSTYAYAIPRIATEYGYNADGFVRVKVTNETTRELACYVAIDGRSIRFVLPPRGASRWYRATDKRFTAKSFSIWCDYLEFHPAYQRYKP
ncbi:hypothetical protein [Thalassotalea euphylliae]|uniref:hypothetical protein n=1 Tax=Thalassotalea euphylliae TaxID=1655234 RepID=UPI0011C064C3|nr:hypothetical protein [Thalassotalea euphylliae]